MDEERESRELQFLRQQALSSTQKRRGIPLTTPGQLLGTDLDIEQLFKNKKSLRQQSAPQVIMDAFSSRASRGKRINPSRSQKVDVKHPRRASSGSSSQSSYSSSSQSRSRSHSSYSTSRSSSRSQSSASSRSSSYSNSHSNTYTHSSASPSSRSRTRSPAPRLKPKKSHLSHYHNKLGTPYQKGGLEKRRTKQKPVPMEVHKRSSHTVHGSSPKSDWYKQHSSFERSAEKSRSERRHPRQLPVVVPSSSDGYLREPGTKHKFSSLNRRHRPADYLDKEEAYVRSSRLHRRHFHSRHPPPPPPHNFSSPPPLQSSRLSLHHHPPVHSPHRPHASPPRERRVIRRSPLHSPPPPPPSSHRLHVPRDHFNEHSSRRHPPPAFNSPSSGHRMRPDHISPLPPPPSNKSRKMDVHSPEKRSMRSREVYSRESREGKVMERRRGNEPPNRHLDKSYRHTLKERDSQRLSRREQRSDEILVQVSKIHGHSSSESEYCDEKVQNSEGRSHRESKKVSKKPPEILSVIDSMSPKKADVKEEKSPQDTDNKVSNKDLSGRDLLGDYDFNPFVDLDVELDYDENMEEDLDQPETQPQTDTNNGLKEDKELTGNKGEVLETSSVSADDATTPIKEVDQISREDISSDSDTAEKEGMAISSPIRVTPDRGVNRERKSARKQDKEVSVSSGKATKLSVKERLFVSKRTIEEKRNALGRKNLESLRPSLANRLGPSPSDRHSYRRRYGHVSKQSKGSALEIAEAYKKKKIVEDKLLREEEKQKTKKLTKMLNSQDHKKMSSRRLSPLPDSESKADKERALDQRIDRIKQNNRALEKRKREVEQDKQLYG